MQRIGQRADATGAEADERTCPHKVGRRHLANRPHQGGERDDGDDRDRQQTFEPLVAEVIGMTLRNRALAALAKGASMGGFGLWVIATVIWHAAHGTLPNAVTMGAVGFAALAANAASFALLWAYRGGDANMHSAWICTRNDVLGNFAVLLAALGVFSTGTGWPDMIVATVMAGLGIQGAWLVIRQSLAELRRSVLAARAGVVRPVS